MTTEQIPTRRSLLCAGALLIGPAAIPAAAAAGRVPASLSADEASELDAVHARWLRSANAGLAGAGEVAWAAGTEGRIVGLATDHRRAAGGIAVQPGGRQAIGTFPLMILVETELPRDCTAGQMAHAQGCGFVREEKAGVLTLRFVRSAAGWSVAEASFV